MTDSEQDERRNWFHTGRANGKKMVRMRLLGSKTPVPKEGLPPECDNSAINNLSNRLEPLTDRLWKLGIQNDEMGSIHAIADVLDEARHEMSMGQVTAKRGRPDDVLAPLKIIYEQLKALLDTNTLKTDTQQHLLFKTDVEAIVADIENVINPQKAAVEIPSRP